jgi:SOS-response transcriptional repressor LexA
MGTEAERYNFVQAKSGLSKREFAESLGISKNLGSILGNGKQRLSRDVLERLSDLYKVNINWLLSGKGPSGLEGPDGAIIELLEQEAAAGRGRDIQDYAEKQTIQVPFSLVAPHRPESLRAVYVAGDSMTGEKIYDGDIVIFYPQITRGDAVYVVSVGDTLLVKRVDFDEVNKAITLISANPSYLPRFIAGKDLENVKIEGRVIACLHRM